jgi:hypothetical protein
MSAVAQVTRVVGMHRDAAGGLARACDLGQQRVGPPTLDATERAAREGENHENAEAFRLLFYMGLREFAGARRSERRGARFPATRGLPCEEVPAEGGDAATSWSGQVSLRAPTSSVRGARSAPPGPTMVPDSPSTAPLANPSGVRAST